MGFRQQSHRVWFQITDSESHLGPDYDGIADLTAHDGPETASALLRAGIHVVGVATGRGALIPFDVEELRTLPEMSLATLTAVPLCVFDGHVGRDLGVCALEECCTGAGGAGRDAVEGSCPMSFRVGDDDDLLLTMSQTAVYLLDLPSRIVRVGIEAGDEAPPDVGCLISELSISGWLAYDTPCAEARTTMDGDGDGFKDVLRMAGPVFQLSVSFAVSRVDLGDWDDDDDIAELCPVGVGSYPLLLQVVDETGQIRASEQLAIEVVE
jgi:hypothetical protein